MTRFYDVSHGKVLQFERLLVDEANMTAEELDAVLREPKLARGMVGWLREQLAPSAPDSTISDPFRLTIDYTQSLEQLILAGHYNQVHSDIATRNFPTHGEGRVKLKVVLVQFDRSISSDEVLIQLERLDLRPCTIAELGAFGVANPELQRQFPIVAMGSVWTDRHENRYIGYIWTDTGQRKFDLYWFIHSWRSDCRFLAVRK